MRKVGLTKQAKDCFFGKLLVCHLRMDILPFQSSVIKKHKLFYSQIIGKFSQCIKVY